MNKKIWIGLGVVIIVVVLAIVLSEGKEVPVEDIKMGAILNMTGTFADQGQNSQRGIDMAIGEINAAGGVLGKKITLDLQDNGGDNPKGALDALYNLTQKETFLIIGPNLTPSANVVAPVVEKSNAVMIAPSVGSEKFAELSPRTFNVFPANKFDSFALAEYLYNVKGFKKIAIFGSRQEWEQDQANFVKQKFEELGGTVTSIQLPTVDNLDLKAESLKIKSSNPEAVVFTNYGETGVAAKRLREVGVKTPFYSVLLFGTQIAAADGALEDTVFITTDTVDESFNTKFKNLYQKDPGFPANQAYDAVYLLAKAVKDAKSTDPAAVAMALRNIKEYKGSSGDMTFDADGNAHKPALYYQVKNGKIVPFLK